MTKTDLNSKVIFGIKVYFNLNNEKKVKIEPFQ